MGSLLDSIPGVSAIVDRYYVGSGVAGLVFVANAYVKVAGFEVKLPVDISASARRRVNITEVEGLRDSIKQVTPTCTMDITLAGRDGTWRKSTLPPFPSIPVVGGVMGTVGGIASALLGTSPFLDTTDIMAELFGILRKAEAPVPISDRQGVLARMGVYAAMPLSFDFSPRKPEYAWTMGLAWDLDEDPLELLFPEEEEEQEGG